MPTTEQASVVLEGDRQRNHQQSTPNFDAVLPVATRNNKLAEQAIRSLALYSAAQSFYLITEKNNFRWFEELRAEGFPIILFDEDTLIPSVDLRAIKDFLSKKGANPERAGWYFQQFLKMAVCDLPEISEHYLIWDSDTIMLQPIQFFSPEGTVFIKSKLEIHDPYFETYRNLLKRGPQVDFSFIAEHFMVKKEFMKELITAIGEQPPSDQLWVWKIMNAIDQAHLSHAGFSEYETYGNFVSSHYPESITCRPLPSWRFGSTDFGLSPNKYDLFSLSRRYSYVSFETWTYGKVHRIVAQKLYAFLKFWILFITGPVQIPPFPRIAKRPLNSCLTSCLLEVSFSLTIKDWPYCKTYFVFSSPCLPSSRKICSQCSRSYTDTRLSRDTLSNDSPRNSLSTRSAFC